MRPSPFAFALIFSLLATSFQSVAPAQIVHQGDIQFGYDSIANPTSIVVDERGGVTSDGLRYFDGRFIELNPFLPGNLAAGDPGFSTNRNGGLLVNEGDSIVVHVLDASASSQTGVGYVNYFGLDNGTLEATGRLAVKDNSNGTANLVLDGDSVTSGVNPQFLGAGINSDSGSEGALVHKHLEIDLLDDAAAAQGAYGVLFQLEGLLAEPDGLANPVSDPFWIIWNHGLSTTDFDTLAIPAFIESNTVFDLGDFNLDGKVDLADLDRYVDAVGDPAVGDLEPLDLDMDGTVGGDDFQQHYEQLVETSNGGKGTFAGDLNLDGTVDVLNDAFELVRNLGQPVSSWADGDVDGNGTVDVLGDAFLLVRNLGRTNGVAAPTASAVPEPGSTLLLPFGITCLLLSRRRL